MVGLFVIVSIACFVYYFCTRTLNFWRDNNVAGPKPVPFFGNLLESALRRKHIGVIYKEIYDAYPKEKVIGIYRMTSPTLIIRDLDIVKNILIKDFDAFPERGIAFSKERLGDNLFHCDSDTWRVLRKKFTPVFTSGKLKNVFQVINERGDQFIDYLENVTSKKHEQELHQHFQKYTMSTIIAASFGLNFDLFNNDVGGIIEKAGHYAFKSTFAAETDMLFPNIFKKINVSLYHHDVNRFSTEVVKMALQQKKGIPSDRNDAIDMMLTLRQEGKIDAFKRHEHEKSVSMEFTEHLMAGQVFILFIAGFGNNALTLSYTFFHLAKYPEVQDKLLKEISDVLAKHDGKLTYDSLKEMTYLDQIFAEALRLNPLTNSVQRSAARNYQIPGSDVVIKKGTTVIISPYAIHRDESNFPDPDKFDPERFAPENTGDRHPCSYIPFGAGPRSCIGRQLAKLQYAVAVVKVITKFKVEPSTKTQKIEDYDPMRTLLATKGGIHVNFVPRN
ncbi:Cytochrome P450 6B46 [Operophtera brumata]|uniref:unspecific monooxygenase n=1 Tax=Operophtera brumata TaxID=104452 RepID=A0A0L7LMR7_OPEBR|nr:Cytochrome P450 6B46 [Operophtera brumata]